MSKITQLPIELGKGFVVSKFTKEGQKSIHLKQLTITDYSTGSEFNDYSFVSATEKQLFKSYRTAIMPCDEHYTEGEILAKLKGARIGRILSSEPIVSSRQHYMMSQKNEDGSQMLTIEQIAEKQLVPQIEQLTAAEKKAGKIGKALLDADGHKIPQLDNYGRKQYRLLTVVHADKPDVDQRLDFPIEEEQQAIIPMEENGDYE